MLFWDQREALRYKEQAQFGVTIQGKYAARTATTAHEVHIIASGRVCVACKNPLTCRRHDYLGMKALSTSEKVTTLQICREYLGFSHPGRKIGSALHHIGLLSNLSLNSDLSIRACGGQGFSSYNRIGEVRLIFAQLIWGMRNRKFSHYEIPLKNDT